MSLKFNQVDSFGVIVKEGVRITPSTAPLPVGHRWIPWSQNTVSLKSEMINMIKSYRDYLVVNGGYNVNGKWYHSDGLSRTQQLALVLLGGSLPAGIEWKTMDKTFVTMTPALAAQVFQAAVTKDTAVFAHSESLIAAIQAAVDPSIINIYTGWPENYNG